MSMHYFLLHQKNIDKKKLVTIKMTSYPEKIETLNMISSKACLAHINGKKSFVDIFSDWLLKKGIELDDETYEKISDLHWNWYNGKGMFYNSGKYRNAGKHQLGKIILKELNIKINQ